MTTNPMVPGGPVPSMPEIPPQDQTQVQPTDQSQVSPVDPPQITQVTDGQSISEEQRQVLLDMLSKIREKLGNFHAVNFASKNRIESIRSDVLKQVFEKLQLAGIDLTSQESVAAFLAKLQQTNPDLAANFEKAMEILLGGSGGSVIPQDPTESMDLGISPQNNMNNENINEQADQTTQNIPQG